MVSTISTEELANRCADGSVQLIDVRTPAEFREVHVDGAVNHPLTSFDASEVIRHYAIDDSPVFFICKSGGRSRQAVQQCEASGFDQAVTVDGGTDAWVSAGLPVVRGRGTISLERQVRIAAGFMTLTGAILGYFVHPAFIGLPAFIGAGLMFAGITDTCGMGMALAKMPWNR